MILILFTACTNERAKYRDSQIPDYSEQVKEFCINTHVYYRIKLDYKYYVMRKVSDNGLPEKCHKIEGMK
jgi:hypothetical protein